VIIVKLTGGLSNQMFQYALGRLLSYKNGDKLKLDLNFYNQIHSKSTPRNYELSIFNIEENIAEKKEIEKLIGGNNRVLNKLHSIFPQLNYKKKHIREKTFNFN